MARLRCLEDVENDLRVLKLKIWAQKANSREEWTTVVKDVEVLRES
jgi:hypothetical protein